MLKTKETIKLSSTQKRWIVSLCILLPLFLSSFLIPIYAKASKGPYYDYYKKNLIYVRFFDETISSYYASDFLSVDCECVNLKGESEKVKNLSRFTIDNGNLETYFYGIIDEKFIGITFDLINADSMEISFSSYETDIQKFKVYTVAFSETAAGRVFDYASCYWSIISLPSKVFSSEILSYYSKESTSVVFGINAYPNLLYTFYNNLKDKDSLETTVIFYENERFSGNSFFEKIKNDFLENEATKNFLAAHESVADVY